MATLQLRRRDVHQLECQTAKDEATGDRLDVVPGCWAEAERGWRMKLLWMYCVLCCIGVNIGNSLCYILYWCQYLVMCSFSSRVLVCLSLLLVCDSGKKREVWLESMCRHGFCRSCVGIKHQESLCHSSSSVGVSLLSLWHATVVPILV